MRARLVVHGIALVATAVVPAADLRREGALAVSGIVPEAAAAIALLSSFPAAAFDVPSSLPIIDALAKTAPERPAQQRGAASYYSDRLVGRKTATGEKFSQTKYTAASRDLPLGARVTVTNHENGKSVEVTVNDRGPYVDGRVIDLSKTAARKIGIAGHGIAAVTVEARPSSQNTAELREAIRKRAAEQANELAAGSLVVLAGEGFRDQRGE